MSLNLDLKDPEWITLLKAERAAGKSVSAIAREVEMPRSSVSMLISGSYPAASLDLVTRKHGAAVVMKYRSQVMCPFLRCGIAPDACASFAAAPMSTSNPDKLRHFNACRRCPQNPIGDRDA